MKYLKGYKSFNEEAEFEVTAMAPANAENTKSINDLNKVKKDIDAYNKYKGNVDTIYKTSKTDAEIETKLKNLLGDERGTFISNYITVASDERKVKTMLDNRVANKLKVSEYNDLISMSDNDSQKSAMQVEVAKLNKKISTDEASLNKLKADIEKRKKDIKTNISDIEKDMQNDIKNIS